MANIKINSLPYLTALCASLVAAPLVMAASAEPPQFSIETLPTYVVVSTRTPLSPDRVSPSINYISVDEMDQWQDRRVMDALSRQTGLALSQNGATGSVGSLFIRGTESRHTAILLDGRRLNPGLANLFSLEHLTVDNLNSIQVQRGASSVQYGSSGIGGVIDLRTRSGFDSAKQGHLEGEYGSHSSKRGAASFTHAEAKWALSFEASALSTENERENDTYERLSITQKFDYKLNNTLSLELIGRYTDADKDFPGSVANPSSFANGETEDWLLSPGIRYATDELSAHFFYSRSEFDFSGVNDFGGPFPFENSVDSDELSLQVDVSLSDNVLLTGGANYRKDMPQSSNDIAFDTKFEQTGGFLQLIAPVSETLELRGRVRADHFSEYSNVLIGNVEVIYTFEQSQTSIFTSLANSYSPPTAQDIIFDGDPTTPVDPEKSVSREIGVRKKFEDPRLEIEMLYFRNDIEDLIVFEFDPNTFVSDGFNEEKALTEGVETSVTYQATDNLFFQGSYTYLTAENNSSGERLARRPRHTIQGAVDIQATEEIRFGLQATSYVDRVGFQGAPLKDFILVNLSATWNLSDDVALFARANNLFDKEYELSAGFPALGRAGYLGLRYSF
ncbi:MAG: TonB-dependent receptor [Verrucomicrobia bacterium]|jgi:vitamin B12 transporter|nr:TonB-dependent receptor [Verrucomicrobiota bacterium]